MDNKYLLIPIDNHFVRIFYLLVHDFTANFLTISSYWYTFCSISNRQYQYFWPNQLISDSCVHKSSYQFLNWCSVVVLCVAAWEWTRGPYLHFFVQRAKHLDCYSVSEWWCFMLNQYFLQDNGCKCLEVCLEVRQVLYVGKGTAKTS